MLFSILILAACGSSEPTDGHSSSAPSSSESSSSASSEETPTGIRFDPYEEKLFVGDTLSLGTDYDGEILWTSSDETIATVDEDGCVTGASAGTVTITAAKKNNPKRAAEASLVVGDHVEKVSLPNDTLLLLTGSDKAEAALNASVLPETALIPSLRYESSDTSVVTVDEDGTLRAVAPGKATISVTSQDEACKTPATCEVSVKRGVSSITLSETEKLLYLKDKLTLSAEVLPADAEDTTYTWSSSDSSVATVDEKGIVQVLRPGDAVILCTANDGSGVTGKCKLSVVVGIQKIVPETKTLNLLLGGPEALGQGKIAYSVLPEDCSFTDLDWSSSDETVATVSKDGTVKAAAPGKATITGTTTDPKMAGKLKIACTVTVGNAVRKVSVDWGVDTIPKGSSRKLVSTIDPKDAFNAKLSWKSSDEKVLTVDANGNVRAVGMGSATITCTTTDGSNLSQSQTFKVIQGVTAVTANERGSILIFAGKSTTLHVTVKPDEATNKSVEWSSNDSSIASVDSTGTVTAKRAGVTYITATAKDGSNKSCRFNILVEPALPITIDSLGFGVYNANLLGITVRNYCSRTAIKNFDFTIALYSYDGSKLNSSGSYSLGKDEAVAAGSTRTIKRTLSGVAWAQRIVITITGVKLGDGIYYSIPLAEQETWTFTR